MANSSIGEYIAPRTGYLSMGLAEFECGLEAVFAEMNAALAIATAGQLVAALNGRSDAAANLRRRLGLEEVWIFCDDIGYDDQERVELNAFFSALQQLARHHKARAGDDLVARIEQSKATLTRLWPAAFDALATSGTIGEAEAYELGIGAGVYAIMLEQLGIEPGGRMSRDDFLEISPRLILFWPLTEAGLQSLLGLIREAKSAITAFVDQIPRHSQATVLDFTRNALR